MGESLQGRIERAVQAHIDEVIDLAIEVCEIPAPPFAEDRRAELVHERFATTGLDSWIDQLGNVFTRRPGSRDRTIMVSAHTDTVFPANVDVSVRREGNRLIGPGIGDNSLSVAAMLMLPRLLDDTGISTGRDLLFCANVGEEGLGDLRGIRKAVADHRQDLDAVVVVEGHDLGRVVNAGIGSRRFRITVDGQGGHSWGAFGTPSAIHVLGGMIARIATLRVQSDPKTTFNVGEIEGGVSVNTIAPRAWMTIDLRSADVGALEDLVGRVLRIVEGAEEREVGVTVRAEVIGDRPTGSLPAEAPIVQAALEVCRELGLKAELKASSTDANIPLAEGIPAVCVGLTQGGNVHREDEYIDIEPVATGLTQLAMLVTRLAA